MSEPPLCTEPPLALVGVDFRRAPASTRAKLVLTRTHRKELFEELARLSVASGLCCLDTCNRTEWIVSATNPQWAGDVLRAQMLLRWHAQASEEELKPLPYVHAGREAVEHILSVATGLESLVVAELPIAGQVQRSLLRAQTEGTSDVYLNLLGPIIGRLCRDARKLTASGFALRGLHHVAADQLEQSLEKPARIVVVGLGQMGLKVAGSLTERSGLGVLAANRSLKPVRSNIKVFTLDYLPALLVKADACVLCTSSPHPVLRYEDLEPVLSLRTRPFWVMDLGLPAQMETRLKGHAGVRLIDLEDLENQGFGLNEEQQRRLSMVHERVVKGIAEYVRLSQFQPLTALLEEVHRSHTQMVNEQVPSLMEKMFPNGDGGGLRSRIKRQILAMLRNHTNAVYKSLSRSVIREPDSK